MKINADECPWGDKATTSLRTLSIIAWGLLGVAGLVGLRLVYEAKACHDFIQFHQLTQFASSTLGLFHGETAPPTNFIWPFGGFTIIAGLILLISGGLQGLASLLRWRRCWRYWLVYGLIIALLVLPFIFWSGAMKFASTAVD